MRIIAGIYKSRKLIMVSSKDTRETSDKVRGAVFNSLGSILNEGTILDLFAGSGSYGLEAISRGAKSVLFNDVKQLALKTLNDNIVNLGVQDKSTVWNLDFVDALKKLDQTTYKFDVIFIDPPYKLDIYEFVVNQLYNYLEDDGIIVLEMDKNKLIEIEQIPNYVLDKQKAYGSKKIIFLTKQ